MPRILPSKEEGGFKGGGREAGRQGGREAGRQGGREEEKVAECRAWSLTKYNATSGSKLCGTTKVGFADAKKRAPEGT